MGTESAVKSSTSLETHVEKATLGIPGGTESDGSDGTEPQSIITLLVGLNILVGLYFAVLVVIELHTSDNGPWVHSS